MLFQTGYKPIFYIGNLFQMAFELNGMLDGHISSVTGENVKAAYGGEENSFLDSVIKPIYDVIAKVWLHSELYFPIYITSFLIFF